LAIITLQNIPAELHPEFKKRVEEHHRSLNCEILAALKSAISGTMGLDSTQLEESAQICDLTLKS
jgi:plasmid stability protein